MILSPSQAGTSQPLAGNIAANCGRRAPEHLLCLGNQESAFRPPARQAESAGFSVSRPHPSQALTPPKQPDGSLWLQLGIRACRQRSRDLLGPVLQEWPRQSTCVQWPESQG